MNKNLSTAGIFILWLTVAAGFLQSAIYFLIGRGIVFMDSWPGWFVVMNVITLTASLFMLKYYHLRQYSLAFWSGSISMMANIGLSIVLFAIIMKRAFEFLYVPAIILFIVTTLGYGLCLVFSKAGKQPWLRRAGIFILGIGLVMVTGATLSLLFPGNISLKTEEKINQWTSLLSNFVPVLFIMHLRWAGKEDEKTLQNPPARLREGALELTGIALLVIVIFFAVLLVNETSSKLYWRKFNAKRTGELVAKCEPRTYVSDSGESLHYLLMKPLDYNPQEKYPLVICLPSGGYEAPMAQWLSTDFYREKYKAFLFIPYAEEGAGWGGNAGFVARDQIVYQAITALKDFSIDERRRYVSGVSLGGYGTWHFIATHPDMFAAAIPVCGGGDPASVPDVISVGVWAFHGAMDRNVPVNASRGMIEAVKQSGGVAKYTEYPDDGHDIWHKVTETPGLLDWLFAQQRD